MTPEECVQTLKKWLPEVCRVADQTYRASAQVDALGPKRGLERVASALTEVAAAILSLPKG